MERVGYHRTIYVHFARNNESVIILNMNRKPATSKLFNSTLTSIYHSNINPRRRGMTCRPQSGPRRKKRSKNDRAFAKGYHYGMIGSSKESCPFDRKDLRQSWINGWRLGREYNWMGLTGAAGICVMQI